ncbi:MAG: tetratricopeptide repeat protein [Planctomycetes bacterium]|nr:tetratricopeptide repeat protein [Planctomycetota bacterium]
MIGQATTARDLRVLALVCGLVVLVAVCARVGSAQATVDRAEAAESAYRAGDYERAKTAWSALLEERGEDPRLEYDLGNCEYRLGNHARALWHFERARRRLGGDERVRFNLALTERALGLQGVESTSFFKDVSERLRSMTIGEWFWTGLWTELAGLALLAVAVTKRWRVLSVIALVVAFGGGAALARAATLDPDRVMGVVVLEDQTEVRAEPRTELAPLMKLSAGVRARYVASSPGWVRIRIQDRDGWIERGAAGLY